MAVNKNFAQMSSKKLRELLQTADEESAVEIEKLLALRNTYLNPAKSIQDYKSQFAALYSEMIADMRVDKATVSVSWTSEKINGEWVKLPSVLITF